MLWGGPCLAQSRAQLGPLCTSENTPADQQIDACNKIIALKVFSGEQLATVYFWRAVGWNKKGDYPGHRRHHRGAAAEARPGALQHARLGLFRQGRVRHRDCRLHRRAPERAAERQHLSEPRQRLSRQGDYPHALADYSEAIRLIRTTPTPTRTAAHQDRRWATSTARSPTSTTRSGSSPTALALINRAEIWRVKATTTTPSPMRPRRSSWSRPWRPTALTEPGSVLNKPTPSRGSPMRPRATSPCEGRFHCLAGRPGLDAASKATRRPQKPAWRCWRIRSRQAAATRGTGCLDRRAGRNIATGGAAGSLRRPAARRAGDRQWRLCPCYGLAQSAERRTRGRQNPARSRLRSDRKHRSRP